MEVGKLYKIELRDLQSMLRKKLGDDLIVLDYKTKMLLPMGENYGSTMLKVDAEIKKPGSQTAEELHLVAKMLPATEFQRQLFDSQETFEKEAFLYQEIVPTYQRLEMELGVKPDAVFDIVPEVYGVRINLQPGKKQVDDDTVILLRNMAYEGYYTADRRKGLDLEHGKVAIKALARFHALGMALKHHKPDVFQRFRIRAKCIAFSFNEDFMKSLEGMLMILSKDPVIGEHFEQIGVCMQRDPIELWNAVPSEPWSTITHADFWVNNILFRKDPATGRVDDVKFIDFSNYLFMSPLRDLIFFVMTNFEAETMNRSFDELVDYYYECFADHLKRLGCDMEPFSRDKFDEQLKIDAYDEFPHCPFMINIMTKEVQQDADVKSLMMSSKMEPLCLEKLRRCVKKYMAKGWLNNPKIAGDESK